MAIRNINPPAHTPEKITPLTHGDRLTRDEFERRYDEMPQLKKAELVKGVVYVPSPVRIDHHGEPHFRLIGWLFVYRAATPGLRGGDNSTIRLGPDDEPQPDGLLMIPRDCGGQATVDLDGYVHGAPELVAEVAASSASYDLGVKRRMYLDRGTAEYVVWRVEDHAVDWFVLRGDHYELLNPGPDGILRSEVMPGLWLDPDALVAGDDTRLLAVLHQGIASAAHSSFAQRLQP